MASLTVLFSSANAAVIVSGWASHNRVEPSTSASSNVTVPVGSNPLKPNAFQSSNGNSTCWLMVASIVAENGQNIGTTAQIPVRDARSCRQERRPASWTSCTREVRPSLA